MRRIMVTARSHACNFSELGNSIGLLKGENVCLWLAASFSKTFTHFPAKLNIFFLLDLQLEKYVCSLGSIYGQWPFLLI